MDDIAPAPQADTPVSSAVEDNSPQPTPVAEQITSDAPAPEGQAEQAPINEPAPVEPQSEPETQPSRLERRIDQVEQKATGYNNLLGNLKQIRDSAGAPVPQVPQPRLSDLVQGRESIDPSELDQLGQQVAQAQAVNSDLRYQQLEQRMVINEAISEVEKEAALLENQYEELKDSNPAKAILEQKIQNRFLREALVPNPLNPQQKVLNRSVRLADIAKEEVEAWKQAVQLGQAQTSATLAQQADNSALTPTTDAPVEKSVDDMTVEEHEAYLKSKGYNL